MLNVKSGKVFAFIYKAFTFVVNISNKEEGII